MRNPCRILYNLAGLHFYPQLIRTITHPNTSHQLKRLKIPKIWLTLACTWMVNLATRMIIRGRNLELQVEHSRLNTLIIWVVNKEVSVLLEKAFMGVIFIDTKSSSKTGRDFHPTRFIGLLTESVPKVSLTLSRFLSMRLHTKKSLAMSSH